MKAKSVLKAIVLICLVCACEKISESKPDNFSEKVDALLSTWTNNEPGGAIAVISKGNLIYENYFGLANLSTQKPFSNQSITDIGSISKQFTAFLIALLEEENKISIEDNVKQYLPEMPEYFSKIKIKHLLFHTSGVKDYEALELVKGNFYFEEHMTNKYIVQLMSKQLSPNFEPNTAYEYSNSNYILLTEIIERISGKKLNQFATEKIFRPLKMNDSFFHENQGNDFNNRAIGYEYIDSTYQRPTYKSHLIGDGGLFTTLGDLVKWDANFYNNRLGEGNQTLLERMKLREVLPNGNTNNMAFAQIFTSHPFGENSWSHGGSGGGYRSFYIRFEEPEFSVIALSNSDSKSPFEIANQIVDLYFDVKPDSRSSQSTQKKKELPQSIEYSVAQINNFIGFYREIGGIDVLEITHSKDDGFFNVKWLENRDSGYLSSMISNTLLAENEDSSYQYEFDLANKIITHLENGNIIKKWKKLETPSLSIDIFKGRYSSPEIDHEITLNVSDDKLQSTNAFLRSLVRVGNTVFLDEETLTVVTFHFQDEVVNGFTIDIPRGDRQLNNLRFYRMLTN